MKFSASSIDMSCCLKMLETYMTFFSVNIFYWNRSTWIVWYLNLSGKNDNTCLNFKSLQAFLKKNYFCAAFFERKARWKSCKCKRGLLRGFAVGRTLCWKCSMLLLSTGLSSILYSAELYMRITGTWTYCQFIIHNLIILIWFF